MSEVVGGREVIYFAGILNLLSSQFWDNLKFGGNLLDAFITSTSSFKKVRTLIRPSLFSMVNLDESLVLNRV